MVLVDGNTLLGCETTLHALWDCEMPSLADADGIIRSDQGTWIGGFRHHIGSVPVIAAELWAIWLGLQLAWQMGYRKMIVESNCVETLSVLNSSAMVHPSFNVCQEIREVR
ncbi:putative ribonuclease H protein [Camellia lanceoleosa]|uniref:Ribonuclease H protein n=1 Tax=Camellia lanceoleosa TaxID=1840588 RepID=A0ACC0FHS9_9ERIC|nr:putative ribonuclease H protein [Camellia lanceoleosa]